MGDLRYMIASYRFAWACIGYTVISLMSILDEMKTFPEASVFYLYTVYYYYFIFVICSNTGRCQFLCGLGKQVFPLSYSAVW